MNPRWNSALALGFVALIGCGGLSQFVIAERGGCSLDGPKEVRAGVYELVVSGNAAVAVYRLGDDTGLEDVEPQLAASSAGATPHGTSRVLRIRNEPGLQRDRSAQNSSSMRFAMAPGSYVFVCDWDAGDRSGRLVVGEVQVTS